jgi:hypothetical protein
MVRVGWSADFAEALKQPVDAQAGAYAAGKLVDLSAGAGKQESDIEVTKRQWGAFYGTDLELQLRRRGIDTIILCGISTNIGVESTARNAWELGFNLVIVEDACSAASAEQHQGSMTHIFPRIARVRSTEESSPRYDLYWAPQWSHPKWVRLGITSLEEYARHFNCVEGNTTLYALPKRRLSPAGMNKPTMIFASALNFRPPFRTRPRCAIATT